VPPTAATVDLEASGAFVRPQRYHTILLHLKVRPHCPYLPCVRLVIVLVLSGLDLLWRCCASIVTACFSTLRHPPPRVTISDDLQ